jgi:hypothetical protein
MSLLKGPLFMAAPAQIIANQANAQHSGGPRTTQGKASVSQNALRHGLTARHLVIRPEQQEEFNSLQDSLRDELAPQGAIETITFHDLLHAAWNLHRFRLIEAECSSGNPADFSEPSTTTVLDRLGRYQARAQRAYYKSLQELRTLQTNRALRSIKLDAQEEAEVPVIAAINDLTKQTHSEVTAEAIKQAINLVEYEAGMLKLNAMRNRQERPTPAAPAKTADDRALRL